MVVKKRRNARGNAYLARQISEQVPPQVGKVSGGVVMVMMVMMVMMVVMVVMVVERSRANQLITSFSCPHLAQAEVLRVGFVAFKSHSPL